MSMIWKCLLCGKEYEQPPSTPVKLYCSEHCLNRQYNNKLIPPEKVAEEKARRRALMGQPKSKEERREYNRRKREEYLRRQAEYYAGCEEPRPNRYCHNFYVKKPNGEPMCRNKTWNYYCEKCHMLQRAKARLDINREDSESEWDEF